MFVGNLPQEASEEAVRALFSEYGTVRSIDIARDIFSGKCRGFGFIEMEGHEARAAMAKLDGREFLGRPLKVREEQAKSKHRRGGYRR